MTITLNITTPALNPHSKRQYNADVFCACCGRGIPNRDTAYVAVTSYSELHGELGHGGGGSGAEKAITFSRIADGDKHGPFLGRDSVEWGVFIGSHCAKQLPKEYKVSQRRVMTAWDAANGFSGDW